MSVPGRFDDHAAAGQGGVPGWLRPRLQQARRPGACVEAERVLTKHQIMADYLSIITTGFGHRGVAEAACAYYRAPLQGLSIAQYALLAGVTQAPSIYDPTVNPEAARLRRAQVLAAMLSDGFITSAQAKASNTEPVLDRGPGRPGC